MAKQRFREVKQGRVDRSVSHKDLKDNGGRGVISASNFEKTKAALTDTFMLLMPIMYIVFYLVMDGREGFAEHKLLGWIYILVPLILIQTAFMYFGKGQTPGYKAYNLRVVDSKTHHQPPLWALLFRNLLMVLALATVFGWLMMFFRKDNRGLHDLLSQTMVIVDKR